MGVNYSNLETLPNQNFSLLYLDSSGDIQVDQDDSFSGIIKRIASSLIGTRDYRLLHIFPKAAKQLQPHSIQFLSEKVAKKVGLRRKELEGIQKLSTYYFNPSHTYTDKEISMLKKFLKNSQGSSRILKAISKLQAMEITLNNVNQRALQTFQSYIRLLPKAKKQQKAFKKIRELGSKLGKDGTLSTPMKRKFSLKEMHALERIKDLAPIFRELRKGGIEFSKSSSMGKLSTNIYIAENVLNRVHNLIEKKHAPNVINFIFYDLPNFMKTKPSHLHPMVPIVFRFFRRTDISHASFSYRNEKGHEMETHILGEVMQARRTLSSYPYKTYAPDINKLLFGCFSEELKGRLEGFYGEKWNEILERKYHNLIKVLFENPTYEDLPTSVVNQFISSLGLGCMLSKGPFKKRFQLSEYHGCICAEFVMKSLRQAYMKLEKEVQRDFQIRSERCKQEYQKPKFPSFLSEEQIAASKTPAGLARTLQLSHFAQEQKRPSILADIIRYREFDMKKSLNLPLPWQGIKRLLIN